MLHVFDVNHGTMMTFDVNLAMERVVELKNVITNAQGVHQDKQVMLISGGQALCDDERVCSYAAGTETNPVYLFDKACIEKETLQNDVSYQQDNGFAESIKTALQLNPSYQTVETRTKLALRLHDATKQQVASMRSLVHDEHLMYQGWQAAVANLQDTSNGFRDRVHAMCVQCQKMFQLSSMNKDALNGLESALDNLEKIPVLSTLLKQGGGCVRPTLEGNFQVSLLRWIETQCKNISVRAMFNEIVKKQNYLSYDKYQSLLDECSKVDVQAGNDRMSEISGIRERLAALDHVIINADQQVKELTGIAQGFVRNRETARELQNNSASIDALLTLCESHITQLRIMHEYETSARDALKKCTRAKNELAANLHTRLRWLYFMQRSILNADVKLSMFTQQLNQLQRQVSFLGQVKHCPQLYLASVAEVVRRKTFASNYVKWANKAVSETQVERDREIVKRKTFQSNMTGHFIQRLFHGFSDKPPLLTKKPLRSFDTNLPDITPEHLTNLSQLLPDFSDILQLPLMNTELSSLAHRMITSSDGISSASNSKPVQSTTSPSPNLTGSTAFTTSVSMDDKDRDETTNHSFAVVDSSNIGQSQPGGFVVTSIENVRQDNLQKGFDVESVVMEKSPQTDRLPQRSYSSPTMPRNDMSPESRSPPHISGSVFAQIGDIISPDSPPDSDFFSILPSGFSFPKNTQDHHNTERRTSNTSTDRRSSMELSGKYVLSGSRVSSHSDRSLKKQSVVMAGSPDSLSSTSYQKVDAGLLSSDDEMFHSFTSDQGKDLKSTRKKLLQLQTEYDTLTDESRQEKEELNTLIRKLQNQITEMEKNQQSIETDFERRWSESKSELDDVIKQLESERVERKKAWMEGADLEKKLTGLEEVCHGYKNQVSVLQAEISSKIEDIQKLKSELLEAEEKAASEVSEEKKKSERQLWEEENKHEQELQASKVAFSRIERDLTLARGDLSTADDRIQDLETALSDQERMQEESNIQILELEMEIKNLSEQLKSANDELSRSQEEKDVCLQNMEEVEVKLGKANKQIESLKQILADYETKLDDDRSRIELVRSLRGSLHQNELEKSDLSSELKSLKEEIQVLKKNLAEMETGMQNLRSLAMQDAKAHTAEIERILSSHAEEKQALSQAQSEEMERIVQENEANLKSLEENHARVLDEKEVELVACVEDLKNRHRNETDEIEADRLASVSSAQQSIEELRVKLRDVNRQLEQERKDKICVQEMNQEKEKHFTEECERLLQEKDSLIREKYDLEKDLMDCKTVISDLKDSRKQEAASSLKVTSLLTSQLMSSTDEEMESKRSKIDSGITEDMIESLQATAMECSTASVDNAMTMSVDEHKRVVGVMRKNFEEDKKSFQGIFKKREEEAARRRQMVFNSAIQRVTTSKDLEIQRLKAILSANSGNNPMLSQSMVVPTSSPMVPSSSPRSLPSPPASFDTARSSSSPVTPLPSNSSGKGSEGGRDRVTVANFQIGDTVLVTYNDTYQHFILLTTSRTLHFVHTESLSKLGITSAGSEFKKSMTLASLTDKEYCQARKAQNRFRVDINTKFYRVKVAPVVKKD